MTNATIKAELEAMMQRKHAAAQTEPMTAPVSPGRPEEKEEPEQQAATTTASPVKSKKPWAKSELESIVQRQHLAQREHMMRTPPVSPRPAEKEVPEEQPRSPPPPSSPLKMLKLPWAKKEEEPEVVEEEKEVEEHVEGVYEKQRMRPPEPRPGMLNNELAEAAALKYQKSQRRIQKACAKLDNPPPPEPEKASCGACVIL